MIAAREQDAAGIEGAALRDSYSRCRALAAEHGKTFHLATLLLPAAKRPFVHALYGFARRVDDIVDQNPDLTDDERAEELIRWSEDFLVDLEWGDTSDPISRALIDTVARWQIPHSYFADFLESMRMDLTVRTYPTFADLRTYMWGSAAVIGLQMMPILGRLDDDVRWDVVESHAIDLGLAFQMTNFLRDVGDDLRRGRVYLPQESLEMFGVDEGRLRRGIVDESIRNLLAWEIERTRGFYAAAEPGIELVHPTSQDCLRAASTLYGEILTEIERADYDVFSERVRVGQVRRATVGLNALRGAVTARRGTVTHVPPRPTAPA
ncbi:phytoene/squalene synthase family protein [uncultured Jatrophihabitans sp.]|uniref:phytoene/squalene synthase family protein n=1 Tax=uncultured Jatrophihabitans sp. TaxID=1610747 RepID=UPI0035CC03E9